MATIQQQANKPKRGGGFSSNQSKRGGKASSTVNNANQTPSNGTNGRSTPLNTAPSSPASLPTQPSALQPVVTPESSKQMRERMLYLIMGLVGQTVIATLKGGAIYQGILSTTTTDTELGLALSRVICLSNPEETPKKVLLIPAKDLISFTAASVNLEANTSAPTSAANGKDTFRTDVDITTGIEQDGTSNSAGGGGRELRRWADEVEDFEALEPSASTFAKPATTAASTSKNAWDQFATNERMFGTKTNYDEEIYTTKLDRSGKDFREREKKAAALAQQILSGSTSNPHLAEERGQAIANQAGLDEEDKYSGVIRSSGAYVPPGARKGMEPKSISIATVLASAVTGNKPETATVAPDQPSADVSAKSNAETTASATPVSNADNKDILESFKQFVTGEKKRLQPRKVAVTTKAKDDKLADMIKFSQTFKLKTPIPADLLPLLTKDEKKQKDLLAGGTSTNADASTSKLAVASAGIPAASTSNTPQLKEAALAPRFASPAPAKSVIPPKKNALPEIPSFSELKAAKAAKAANASLTSKVEDWVARTTSPVQPTKLVNPNAKAFQPNPNAAAFNPVPSPTPKAAVLPAGPSQKEAGPVQPAVLSQPSQPQPQPQQPQATPAPHPFFGHKVIKKGSPSMHVKEDFSPFKRSDVPASSSVSPSWNYTGKPYKSIFIPAAGPSSTEDPIGRPTSSNAGASSMQMTPSQAGGLLPHTGGQMPPNMQQSPHMLPSPGIPPQGYQMYYPPPGPYRYNGPQMGGQFPAASPGQQHMYQPQQQQYMNQMNFPSQGMNYMPPPQPGYMNPNYRQPSFSGASQAMYGNNQHTSPQPQHRQYDNQNFSRRPSGVQGPPNQMIPQNMLPGAMNAQIPQVQGQGGPPQK